MHTMEKIPMTIIQRNPIIYVNQHQITEIRKLFYKDESSLKQDIDVFEDWVKKQYHFCVREFPRKYLERYLIANKGSLERTKQRFDRLCSLRGLLPELTQNYDIKNEFHHLLKCTRQCVVPTLTKDHYRVIVSQVHNVIDVEKSELIHFYRLSVVFIEYMLHNDYNAGIEFIMDNRLMSLGLLAKMNPIVIHKAFRLLKAYGLRLKTLHVLSNSKFLDSLVSLMKQGMSEKLGKRIQIHQSMESLHQHIDKDILPKDLGGLGNSVQELSEKFMTELRSEDHIATMKFLEGATTDESCRLTRSFNEELAGLPGSFRNLCVD